MTLLAECVAKLQVVKQDISKLSSIDAIVNAANTGLLGGFGVDGAIHNAAGPRLLEACRVIAAEAKTRGVKPCPVGAARVTPAFDLSGAKIIIHTVGPSDGKSGHLLAQCYRESLNALVSNTVSPTPCRSIAFPCISTGAYGFPQEAAADIAVNTVAEWLRETPENLAAIEKVVFCCFLDSDVAFYGQAMSALRRRAAQAS